MTAAGLSNNVLDAIGDTPLVELEGIYCKLEYLNPSGSIKARIAKYMIERAEDEGLLKHGDTIVEATSGNTGNALSMVAAVKGYRMLVVMPEGMSGERVAISRAFGAEVLEVGHFHVNEALAKARELGTGARLLRSRPVRERVERRGEPHLARAGDPIAATRRRNPGRPGHGCWDRGNPYRCWTGFPRGQPTSKALCDGAYGIRDHFVWGGWGSPHRRHRRRVRTRHLPAPRGQGGRDPVNRERGGRTDHAATGAGVWAVRGTF